MLHTPVVLFVFSRPDTTERVFAEIARAKPTRLFLVADGPRANVPGEAEKCSRVRSIIDRVDWPCEVLKNYSDVNLGTSPRIASGFQWVFEHVDRVIYLEDDVLPDPTFFRFCEELLERYLSDSRVMVINGNDLLLGKKQTPYSYFFNRYGGLPGYATWRRAWLHMDMEISLWRELRNTTWLSDIFESPREVEHWRKVFDNYKKVELDRRWIFCQWAQNGLQISPNSNLVSNIGFGPDATRTKSTGNRLANLPLRPMLFPLSHPPYLVRDREADRIIFDNVFPLKRNGLKNRMRHIARFLRRSNTDFAI